MSLLNEIYRMKNIMYLHEAANPILGSLTSTFINKAWKSIVSKYSSITDGLKNALSKVPRTDLDDIFRRVNPGLSVPADIDGLIDDLISSFDSLTPEEVTTLIKTLSSFEPFKTSLIESFMSSDSFKNVMSRAFNSGITPQQIRQTLVDELGDEAIVDDLIKKLRIDFDASKLMGKSVETFTLPASSVNELMNVVKDPSLKTTIKGYLTPNRLNELFDKAQKASLEGVTIDSNYFKTEFARIVKENPDFWTEVRRGEINKLAKRLLTIFNQGGKPGEPISKTRKNLAILALLGIAGYWVRSQYYEGKEETYQSFLQKCLVNKGYKNQDDIDAAKINDLSKLNLDFADCKKEAESLAIGSGIEKVSSNVPTFKEEDKINIDNVFGTTTQKTQTTTPTTPITSEAETWFKANGYWAQGMTFSSGANPNQVVWKSLDGQTGTVTKQSDGSFK